MDPASIAILINQLPVLIACVVGLITSIVLFNRRRVAAGFALGGFLLLIASNLSNVFATNWFMKQVSEGVDSKEAGIFVGIVHLFSSFASAIALMLLLIAIFVKSKKAIDS